MGFHIALGSYPASIAIEPVAKETRMPSAQHGSAETERRDDAGLAEVDGLGVAAVVLYGRDDAERRVEDERRSFAPRSSWLLRWAGWRRHG
jgi:hypothetical protein